MTSREAYEIYRYFWFAQGEECPVWEGLAPKSKFVWDQLLIKLLAQIPQPEQNPLSPAGKEVVWMERQQADKLQSDLKRETDERRRAKFQEERWAEEASKWKRLHSGLSIQNAELGTRIKKLIEERYHARPQRRVVRHGFFHVVRSTLSMLPEEAFAANRDVESTGFLCESQEMQLRIASAIECAPDLPIAEVIGWIQQARKAQKLRELRAVQPVPESVA